MGGVFFVTVLSCAAGRGTRTGPAPGRGGPPRIRPPPECPAGAPDAPIPAREAGGGRHGRRARGLLLKDRPGAGRRDGPSRAPAPQAGEAPAGEDPVAGGAGRSPSQGEPGGQRSGRSPERGMSSRRSYLSACSAEMARVPLRCCRKVVCGMPDFREISATAQPRAAKISSRYVFMRKIYSNE